MDYLKEERRKRNKKKRMIRRITMTIMAIMILALSGCCIFLLIQYNNEKNRTVEAFNEITSLEEQLYSGDYITSVEADKLIEEASVSAKNELLNDIQSRMENGDTTLTLLENLFPDKIVTAHDGSYHFFDINDALAKNEFSYED